MKNLNPSKYAVTHEALTAFAELFSKKKHLKILLRFALDALAAHEDATLTPPTLEELEREFFIHHDEFR